MRTSNVEQEICIKHMRVEAYMQADSKLTSYFQDLISLVCARHKYRNIPFSRVSVSWMFAAIYVAGMHIRDPEHDISLCVLSLTLYRSRFAR